MICHCRYLTPSSESKPFKIVISSKRGYFDALSVSKDVKFGYETTFDVHPIEVRGTNDLKALPEDERNCKFSDEVTRKDSMFQTYSQSSCEFECRVNKAREECQCTPWNFPTPPSIKESVICDLYGNYCFHNKMRDVDVIKNCTNGTCLSDCNDIRFRINAR